MKVKDIMTYNPEVIQALDLVEHAADKMRRLNVGAIPVFDGDKPAGMLTDRDIAIRVVAQKLDPATTSVGDVMSGEIIFCTEDMDIEEAAHIMEYKKIRRLLVKGKTNIFIGMLSLGDIAMSAGAELSGEALHEISGIAHPER
jgi:CBS domain-containing protein